MKKNETKAAKVATLPIKAENTVNAEIMELNDQPQPEAKSEVSFRIQQCTSSGKTSFEIQQSVTIRAKDAIANGVTGIAKKIAFYMADTLHTIATEALAFKEQHGYYGTSFRPKAVFKVIIAIDNRVHFMAINTKGIDSIHLMQAKPGKKGDARVYQPISRGILVQKFGLLALTANAPQKMADGLSFAFDTEAQLSREIENEAKLTALTQ